MEKKRMVICITDHFAVHLKLPHIVNQLYANKNLKIKQNNIK